MKILLNKQIFVKFIIPIVYFTAVILMFVFTQNYEKAVRDSTPLYIDITESPVFIRHGFSVDCLRPENFDKLAEDLRNENDWAQFLSNWPLLIKDSPLTDLPQRRFMSPYGSEVQEFTILIPLEIGPQVILYLEKHGDVIPGIHLAGIGDNWQIYFNGTLVISQMKFTQETLPYNKNREWILENRVWRNVSFPIDRSLIIPGINLIAFRIIGDPTSGNTGLFFNSPYYLDDYNSIQKYKNNYFLLVLCGVFLVSGVYYFVLYLSLRTKREIYFLLFSIFSLLLCIFVVSRHSIINIFIHNSAVSQRIEFYSYMLAVVVFGMFIETFGRGKITKVSLCYLLFVLYFILTIQFFPAAQYKNDFAFIANLTNIFYYFYIFLYSVIYYYFYEKKVFKNKDFDISVISIISGACLIFFSDIYEIALYFTSFSNYNFFIYSAIAVQIGMIFTLAQRYNKLEKDIQQNKIAIMLSQIQPHFLYNSLSVIRQLCKTNPETAEETVLEFSNYLRHNMDSMTQKELIPFKLEMQHVRVYLALEKKRIGDMLNVVYEINFDNFMLPALVLQPIVENAVNHGITKNTDGGTIKIKTDKIKDNVVITVTDDGCLYNEASGKTDNRSHIGIENVRNRLKMMCGGKLEIQSKSGTCTTATIIIPIIKGNI